MEVDDIKGQVEKNNSEIQELLIEIKKLKKEISLLTRLNKSLEYILNKKGNVEKAA